MLISPVAVNQPDWETHSLPTVLSRANIDESPGLEADQPVSRRNETVLTAYYNWPVYWGFAPAAVDNAAEANADAEDKDPHLRSVADVTGYRMQCMEGEVGHVEDVVVDTETWALRYLVIDTRNWLPGRKVILPLDGITHFSWEDRQTHIDLTQDQVECAPEFDSRSLVNRESDSQLYDFYGRPTYWGASFGQSQNRAIVLNLLYNDSLKR